MNKIKNVLLCGLGGVGCVCASAIHNSQVCNLKILVDKERYLKYIKEPTFFNNKEYIFDYILPEETNYKSDLIVIATKYDALQWAITNIKNFIHKNTIILSLLNGISSEEEIADIYGWEHILTSFFLGHSCIRDGRNIEQDGIYNIIIGSTQNSKDLSIVSDFFNDTGINYLISENIINDYWKKFMINVGINQLCAITGLNLKEIKKDKTLIQKLKNLINEVKLIAEKIGIENHEIIYNEALKFLLEDIDDAQPSMLQDIKSKRKTEIDIFAGTVIKLGAKYSIKTPENEKIYKQIKDIENHYT